MTYKDFKEGMEVTCELFGIKTNDLVLRYKDNKWYVVSEKLLGPVVYNGVDGKFYRWIPVEEATNLQPKLRTIDDLECGDYVVNKGGYKRKCLGRCGEVYAMSSWWSKEIDNNERIACDWFTAYQLKTAGWTLYQPDEPKEESDIDKCIKVVEGYFEKGDTFSKERRKELVQALKNLKNKYETKNN